MVRWGLKDMPGHRGGGSKPQISIFIKGFTLLSYAGGGRGSEIILK